MTTTKLIAGITFGAFAAIASAQTAAPAMPAPAAAAPAAAAPMAAPTAAQRQEMTKAATAAGNSDPVRAAKQQAANVEKSKATKPMTVEEKNAMVKAANAKATNPNNPTSGVAGTAVQQKANVAVSKDMPKANADMATKAGQDAMAKDLATKATR